MSCTDAVRFLDHEARRCRDHDAHEAFCLLLPALRKTMELPPMDDHEALEFYAEFQEALKRRLEQEADARPVTN